MVTPGDHIDALEGHLRYFLNRIKDHPDAGMVELVDANIRERLGNISAAIAAERAAPVLAHGFDADLVADMLSNYQRRVAAESGESVRTKIIQQQADALRALAQQPGGA